MNAAGLGRIVYLSEVEPDTPPQLFEGEPDVMTVRHVSELLGVDHKTVRREIARGRLKCSKVGACVRVTKLQLLDYLEGANA